MAAAGVVLVSDTAGADRELYGQVQGYLHAPGDFLFDRLWLTEIDRLVAQGWLTPQSHVGLHALDTAPRQRLVETVVEPALARHGIPIAARAAISPGEDGLGQYPGTTLQFRSAGVDRVLDVGTSPLFFMQQAEGQGYRPQWSVDSIFGPGALLETAAPPEQLRGAAGMGWLPWSDVSAARNPGPVSDQEVRCLALMDAAGQGSPAGTTKLFQLQLCDGFFFLQTALAQQGPGLTAQALAGAASALGDRFVSPVTFRSDFAGGRPDGAAAVRDLAFLDECGCFAYVERPRGDLRVAWPPWT